MGKLPEPGDVIADRYVVERYLGRGGMGAVFVVTHRLTGKHLALKCLLPEYLDDEDTVERFLREAQAAGCIQHRHVVDIFDVGRAGDVLFLVMPLLEGKPLSTLLTDDRLTLEETIGILLRAMEGVAAAHAQGIVHRDLKPDNIFVCIGPSGRLDDPRVLDFGISKVDDDARMPLTRSGVMMGTPYYMSFEQLNSQRDFDHRVDVYAMGVILYEAIAGSPPHMGDSVAQLAIRMMSQAPVHLQDLRPDLPHGLGDVAMKAIARDRDDRYASMHAFTDALRAFAPASTGSMVPDGAGTPLRTAPRLNTPMPSARSKRAGAEDPTIPIRAPLPQELLATAHKGTGRVLKTQSEPEPRMRTASGATGSMLWVSGAAVAALTVLLAGWALWPKAGDATSSGAPVAGAVADTRVAAQRDVLTPTAPVAPAPSEPSATAHKALTDAGAAASAALPAKPQKLVKRQVKRKKLGKRGETVEVVEYVEVDANSDAGAAQGGAATTPAAPAAVPPEPAAPPVEAAEPKPSEPSQPSQPSPPSEPAPGEAAKVEG